MEKAVVYARYSSDAQTEQSIEGQLRVCKEYAEKHGILIVDTYIDRAMTGTNDMRPDFQRMIRDSAKRQWSYVIVYKLDRFSRDRYAMAVHKHTLQHNGVKLVSAMENIPDGPEGIMLESLLEGMNQYYSAELAQKVKRGMRETRQKGNYHGGPLLYGYRVDGRKLVIHEEHAEVVRYIYEEYARGVFAKDIITSLTEKGILYKGKPFCRNTIYGILSNPKYSGVYMLGDEVVDKVYPQIIPTELCNIVRAKCEANKNGKRSTEVVYLLRQKVKCGCCGQNMIAESCLSRTGIRRYYYKCRGRKSLRNGCTQTIFRKDVLEQYVIDNILVQLSQPSQIEYVTKKLLEIQEQSLQMNTVLSIYQKEQKQNETAIYNIMAAIEGGVFTKTTSKRLHELEERQEELERLIAVESCKTQVKLTAHEIRQFYKTALAMKPEMLVSYLVKSVVVNDDEIQIYYNNPLPTSPDDSQGFLLYEKCKEMPYFVIESSSMSTRMVTISIRI